METTWRQCEEWFQLIRQEVRTGRLVKNMLWLKVIGTLWNELWWALQTGAADWQKAQLNIKKYDRGIKTLAAVLVRSVNYEWSVSTSKEKYPEAKKKNRRVVYKGKRHSEKKRFGEAIRRHGLSKGEGWWDAVVMPGCGTKNSTFILRHLQEKYLAKKKNLYLALKLALCTRVPRDVVWWILRKQSVE